MWLLYSSHMVSYLSVQSKRLMDNEALASRMPDVPKHQELEESRNLRGDRKYECWERGKDSSHAWCQVLGRGTRSMTSLLCGWVKLRHDRSTLAALLLWFCLGQLKRAQTWRRAGGPNTGWSLPSTCGRLVGSALVGATHRPIYSAETAQFPVTTKPEHQDRWTKRSFAHTKCRIFTCKRCRTSAVTAETAVSLILLASLHAAQVHRIQICRLVLWLMASQSRETKK